MGKSTSARASERNRLAELEPVAKGPNRRRRLRLSHHDADPGRGTSAGGRPARWARAPPRRPQGAPASPPRGRPSAGVPSGRRSLAPGAPPPPSPGPPPDTAGAGRGRRAPAPGCSHVAAPSTSNPASSMVVRNGSGPGTAATSPSRGPRRGPRPSPPRSSRKYRQAITSRSSCRSGSRPPGAPPSARAPRPGFPVLAPRALPAPSPARACRLIHRRRFLASLATMRSSHGRKGRCRSNRPRAEYAFTKALWAASSASAEPPAARWAVRMEMSGTCARVPHRRRPRPAVPGRRVQRRPVEGPLTTVPHRGTHGVPERRSREERPL